MTNQFNEIKKTECCGNCSSTDNMIQELLRIVDGMTVAEKSEVIAFARFLRDRIQR